MLCTTTLDTDFLYKTFWLCLMWVLVLLRVRFILEIVKHWLCKGWDMFVTSFHYCVRRQTSLTHREIRWAQPLDFKSEATAETETLSVTSNTDGATTESSFYTFFHCFSSVNSKSLTNCSCTLAIYSRMILLPCDLKQLLCREQAYHCTWVLPRFCPVNVNYLTCC